MMEMTFFQQKEPEHKIDALFLGQNLQRINQYYQILKKPQQAYYQFKNVSNDKFLRDEIEHLSQQYEKIIKIQEKEIQQYKYKLEIQRKRKNLELTYLPKIKNQKINTMSAQKNKIIHQGQSKNSQAIKIELLTNKVKHLEQRLKNCLKEQQLQKTKLTKEIRNKQKLIEQINLEKIEQINKLQLQLQNKKDIIKKIGSQKLTLNAKIHSLEKEHQQYSLARKQENIQLVGKIQTICVEFRKCALQKKKYYESSEQYKKKNNILESQFLILKDSYSKNIKKIEQEFKQKLIEETLEQKKILEDLKNQLIQRVEQQNKMRQSIILEAKADLVLYQKQILEWKQKYKKLSIMFQEKQKSPQNQQNNKDKKYLLLKLQNSKEQIMNLQKKLLNRQQQNEQYKIQLQGKAKLKQQLQQKEKLIHKIQEQLRQKQQEIQEYAFIRDFQTLKWENVVDKIQQIYENKFQEYKKVNLQRVFQCLRKQYNEKVMEKQIQIKNLTEKFKQQNLHLIQQKKILINRVISFVQKNDEFIKQQEVINFFNTNQSDCCEELVKCKSQILIQDNQPNDSLQQQNEESIVINEAIIIELQKKSATKTE